MPGVLQNLIYINNAKIGVTDFYEAPAENAIASADLKALHPNWKYLGVIQPGSFKNSNTKQVYDLKTGLPETVKASYVTGIDGKITANLIEWTGAAIRAAVGGAEPARLYTDAQVAISATGPGSVSSVQLASNGGASFKVGDDIEVRTVATADFGDSVNKYTSLETSQIQTITADLLTVYPWFTAAPSAAVPSGVKTVGGYKQPHGLSVIRYAAYLAVYTATDGTQVITYVPKARSEGLDPDFADKKESVLPLNMMALGVLLKTGEGFDGYANQPIVAWTFLLRAANAATFTKGGVLAL